MVIPELVQLSRRTVKEGNKKPDKVPCVHASVPAFRPLAISFSGYGSRFTQMVTGKAKTCEMPGAGCYHSEERKKVGKYAHKIAAERCIKCDTS